MQQEVWLKRKIIHARMRQTRNENESNKLIYCTRLCEAFEMCTNQQIFVIILFKHTGICSIFE